MTDAGIARRFVEKGWQIRYRGGNAVCSTPSDLDLIVADAPGDPPRYSIASWPSGGRGLVLCLYDAERGVAVRVRRVPAPERAAELLARYGAPEHEARDLLGRHPPTVPEAAEGPVRPGTCSWGPPRPTACRPNGAAGVDRETDSTPLPQEARGPTDLLGYPRDDGRDRAFGRWEAAE